MKIAIISNIFSPHVRGGYELGCQKIASHLQDIGHQVEVLTSCTIGQLAKKDPAHDLTVREIFEPIFEYEVMPDVERSNNWQARRRQSLGGFLPTNMRSLSNYVLVSNPDVFWVFNPLGLGPIGIFETLIAHRQKIVVHLMDNIDGVIADHQGSINLLPRLIRLKKQISAISCSRKIKNANEKHGAYKTHRIIYNAFDFSSNESLIKSAPNKDEVIRFVYFGQVEKTKGMIQCAKALAALRERHPDYQFEWHIVGAGSRAFQEEFRLLIKGLKIDSQVTLHGLMNQEALFSLASKMDIALMLLSDAEPFAYSPLEASSLGLPVIITSGTGNAEGFPNPYPLMVKNRDDVSEVVDRLLWCRRHRETLGKLALSLRDSLKQSCDLYGSAIPAYLDVVNSLTADYQPADLPSALSTAHYLVLLDSAFASR